MAVVEATDATRMRSCVDSACGGGNLLRASEAVFPTVRCVGMDRDARAIAKLAREKPKWVLTRGDLMRPRTWDNPAVLQHGVNCDYVLMNPPFSMARSKGIPAAWSGKTFRASVAMAHVLETLRVFQPRKGGCAVVPESLMYSELDANARAALGWDYVMTLVRELKNSTFKGARANALVVRIQRRVDACTHDEPPVQAIRATGIEIIRGGMPLFEANYTRRGLPLVHSTNLFEIVHGAEIYHLPRVTPLSRGRVDGNVVLIPRVGVPRQTDIGAIRLRAPVQLSDCVIAFKGTNSAVARRLAFTIRENWDDFVQLYRGTGARYTTVNRVAAWLGVQES